MNARPAPLVPPQPAMTDNLHRVLNAVEEMALPEGEYLRVANALRDVFNARPDRTTRPRIYNIGNLPTISYQRAGSTISMEVRRACRKIYETHADPCEHETQYRVKTVRKDGRVSSVDFTSPSCVESVVRQFLGLHRPLRVTIKTEMGTQTVTYRQAQLAQIREYKSMRAFHSSGALTDSHREDLEETMSEYSYFNYGEFISNVSIRIHTTDYRVV